MFAIIRKNAIENSIEFTDGTTLDLNQLSREQRANILNRYKKTETEVVE